MSVPLVFQSCLVIIVNLEDENQGKVFKSKHILVDYFLWGISRHSLESSPLPLLSSAELTFKPTLENVAERQTLKGRKTLRRNIKTGENIYES